MTPAATTTRILPTANPTIVGALTEEAIDQVVPAETAVSVTPSATPCIPPTGWVRYQVRPGDTLFSLAQLTETEVETIKTANCLPDDFLAIDQMIYLPKLPPPPPPIVAAVPEAAQAACASLLSCPVNRQIGYVRQSLSPAEPSPCTESEGEAPYIEASGFGDAFVGERTYFFACNFSNPKTWQISLRDVNGQDIQLDQDRDFNPLLTQQWQKIVDQGNAQLVFVWSVACDVPAGTYTLTIQANSDPNNKATFGGFVDDLNSPQILVAPQVGQPGTSFDVYFCDFPKVEPILISVNYGFEQVDEGQQFYQAKEISIPIDNQGAGSITITTRLNDEKRNYELRFGNAQVCDQELEDEQDCERDLFVLWEGDP